MHTVDRRARAHTLTNMHAHTYVLTRACARVCMHMHTVIHFPFIRFPLDLIVAPAIKQTQAIKIRTVQAAAHTQSEGYKF